MKQKTRDFDVGKYNFQGNFQSFIATQGRYYPGKTGVTNPYEGL